MAFRERLPRCELKEIEVISISERRDQPNRYQKDGEEAFKWDVRVKECMEKSFGTFWGTYSTEVVKLVKAGQKYTLTVKVGNKKPREDGGKHEFPHLITIESAYLPGKHFMDRSTAPSPAPEEPLGEASDDYVPPAATPEAPASSPPAVQPAPAPRTGAPTPLAREKAFECYAIIQAGGAIAVMDATIRWEIQGDGITRVRNLIARFAEEISG